MAGIDPNLQNQALAALGSQYRVPTLEEARANAEQFFPAAVDQRSLLEQSMGAQQMPQVDPGFSMVPPQDQPVVMADQPAPARAAVPLQETAPEYVPTAAQQPPATPVDAENVSPANSQPQRLQAHRAASMGGIANPLPGMVKDASKRQEAAGAAMHSAKIDADVAAAGIEQSTEDLGAARQRTANELAQVSRDTAAAMKAQADQYDDEVDTLTKANSKAEARHRAKAEELGKFEVKDRRPVTQRVMGALAVALSGLADQANLAAGLNIGLNVQTNLAAQAAAMIDRGIERDLEMQRQMLENKRTEVAALGTELGYLANKFGDLQQAHSFAKMMKLDQSIAAAEAVKAQGLGEEQTMLADQTINELRLKRATIEAEAQKAELDQATNEVRQGKMAMYNQQQAARAAAASAPDRMLDKSLDRQKKVLELRKGEQELRKGEQELQGGADPYGLRSLGGGKPSKEAVGEAQKLVSNAEGVRATIGQLRQMAMKGGTLSDTERTTAARRVASLSGQFNGVFGDGSAPNEAQLEQVKGFMVNPTEYTLKDVVKILDDFDRDAVDFTNAKVRGYGFAYEGGVDVRPE